mmetsp:Transcript_6419/g.9452  ORF Transcript_6419/g.9452 Transcript_6419/m.9452 type:complete len:198 (+) Transcript_6419:149-742(+)|eukprot:CAMPEP_0194229796 /NCGR_PEP_ID=MMETSP0156-20130528/44074_1 /TAXON_ID=33649 /ORGANISM="Thalassionema nitzschioides, Strain L26-B" /LENGTH=197 /DNA_ID=CAMNT_0038962355 /DNA_START=108 /DNA_END=701 /DNA_ORIENTATION=+
MSSTLDELEQIERSARVGASSASKGGPRRGSSMFSGADAVMNYKDKNNKGSKPADLLEDFPKREAAPKPKQSKPQAPQSFYSQPAPVKPPANMTRPSPMGGGPAIKRGSVALKPMSGIGGLVDFDDSDFDDSDEEDALHLPGAPMPGSANAVGGPNHRPLVGGFAAAAYEAARAHHYQNVGKGQPSQGARSKPPPSI